MFICPHFKCFDAVGWASERASGLEKLRDEVLVWLSVWSEVFAYSLADATAIPKPHNLASFKSLLVLPAYLGCVGKEAIKRV